MSTIRVSTLVIATLLASSSAVAQSCIGKASPGKTYLGFQGRSSWTGHNRLNTVYGGELSHRFDVGQRTGISASLEAAGNKLQKDSSAITLAGTVALSHRLAIDPNLSLCAATGIDIQALDIDGAATTNDNGYIAMPITLGAGYDIPLGGVVVTPFIAPTIAHYEFETPGVQNGARQKGWDFYTTTGVSASLGRVSVSAALRSGDFSLGDRNRWTLGSGISF